MTNGTQPVTVRTARWCAAHPWRAVVGWLLFVVLCLAAGTAVGTNEGTVEDFWIGEAGRAESMADTSDLNPAPTEQVLITATGSNRLDEAAAVRAADDVRLRMDALPAVTSTAEPVWSADRTALLVDVTLRGDQETAEDDVPDLLAQTAAAQAAHPDLTVEQTGNTSISADVNGAMGQNLLRTEAISLPVTFLILLAVFGTMLAAGIPIVLALTAFTGAVGLYGLASWVFPDAGGAAMSVIFLLGMAVGVDYSLFYLKRVREEHARSGDVSHTAAIEAAAATSGRAVLGSGTAVVLALVGLYVADDVIFSSIATGAILVTALAVIGSLTVLPALLALLGDRIERRIGRRRERGASAAAGPGRSVPGPARENAMWAALLGPVVRRPLVTLLVGVAATTALAAPALSMRLGTEGTETFPDTLPSVATYDRMTAAFPSQGAAHLVLARGDGAAAVLQDLADRTRGDELFAQDEPAEVTLADDGSTALLRLPVPFGENSSEAQRSLERLREELVPEAVTEAASGPAAHVEVAVSGEVARGVDYAAHQAERLPWVIAFVCLTTLGIMYLTFRSVPLALLGVLLNLAAVLVSWGVLTLVFQGTWAEGLLGFESVGFVGSRTPLMVVAILVGLSTDYQIFVVSRIREAAQRGIPTRQAVVEGIAGSASVVTSAAVIMVSIFGSFLFFDRIEMKQIAVGLTVAVLFDAIVLRALILPAVITLLGERTWWPARTRPRPVLAPGVRQVS